MHRQSLPDHYATLGLDRKCTLAQVRTAYRLLAKRHHPDLNGGAAEALAQTQALNAAYEVLSDPARRAAYDRELTAATAAAPTPPPRTRIERSVSIDARLRIEEFFRGTTLQVRLNDPGNPNGIETYQLEVPAGTAPGTRVQIKRNAPFEGGHVRVKLKVRPGGRFKASGSNLRCELRISFARAFAGGVENFRGPLDQLLRVSIPARVPRGTIITIPGHGLPKAHGGRGDLLVRVSYRPEARVEVGRRH